MTKGFKGLLTLLLFYTQICAQQFSYRQHITDANRRRYDHLGTALARNENVLVAGIPEKDLFPETDTAIVEVGKVNVYEKCSGKWLLKQEIASPHGQEFSRFGHCVALKNDVMAISAPLFSFYEGDSLRIKQAGRVYIYKKDNSGIWLYDTSLSAPAAKANSWFGFSLLCTGSELIVGAPLEDEGDIDYAGAVYVYKRDGNRWIFAKRIISSKPGAGSKFGNAIAALNNDIVVAAPSSRVAGVQRAGMIEVFSKQPGYEFQQVIYAPHQSEGAAFGSAVYVSHNRIIAGAPGMDAELNGMRYKDAGSVYTYHFMDGSWKLQQTIIADDVEQGALFGAALEVSGPYLAVAAPVKSLEGQYSFAGAVYLFKEKDSGLWFFYKKLVSPVPTASAGFGKSIAMWFSEIVVGAYREGNNVSGEFIFDAGALYDYGNE
jgi:hypothetical protein